MKKLLGIIFTPVHYLYWAIILLVFHPIQWLSLKSGGYSAHKRSVDIMNFFLLGSYYIQASPVIFINRQVLPENRPIVFIANHQSMYDIPPLIWHLRKYHAKFISKIELTKGIPSISFNLRYGGGANIDRKDSKQAVAEILKLAQRMKANNWSAVIFPEGTRSRKGILKPFAVGGVATLLKRVPHALIVPVAISGAWKLIQYGTFPLSFGEKLTWTVLDPIEPRGRNAEEIIRESEQSIKKALNQ